MHLCWYKYQWNLCFCSCFLLYCHFVMVFIRKTEITLIRYLFFSDTRISSDNFQQVAYRFTKIVPLEAEHTIQIAHPLTLWYWAKLFCNERRCLFTGIHVWQLFGLSWRNKRNIQLNWSLQCLNQSAFFQHNPGPVNHPNPDNCQIYQARNKEHIAIEGFVGLKFSIKMQSFWSERYKN